MQESQVLARYENGERAGNIAASMGLDRGTVTKIVRRMGGQVRAQTEAAGRPRFPEVEWMDRVTKLRDQGLSQREIGAELGMSQAVVGRILSRAGYPTMVVRRGANHGSWKGGRIAAPGGYTALLVAPDDALAVMRNCMGYVLEHRLVMARSLGRPLTKTETVHHINGIKVDNRIENLQLRQGRHGNGVKHVCSDCGSHNVVEVAL